MRFIFRMQVKEVSLPKKMDWLGDWEDEFEEEDYKTKLYELYFPTFEEMSEELDRITEGYHQYWADVCYDIYDNSKEILEYHNAKGEWDREIHVETSRVYLTDSLLSSINTVNLSSVKKVENLSVKDYDEVEDLLFELLQEHYGIERYSFDYLEKNVEYVAGTINIVKLGDKPKTLKHRHHNDNWSEDIEITESYEYATYYRLDKLNELCKNVLSGSWSETYNFNRVLNMFK